MKSEYLNLRGHLLYIVIVIDMINCNAFKKEFKYASLIEPVSDWLKNVETAKT
jgi:hypothetical protein